VAVAHFILVRPMSDTPWMLTVSLPGERDPVFLGPVFATSARNVERRKSALLRATALRALDAQNPALCDRFMAAASGVVSHCTLYDLSCFASPKHSRYFSTSRFTRNVSALNTLLKSRRGERLLQDLRTRYET
jgi:hypothetical protein